jgi:hypothetical protein
MDRQQRHDHIGRPLQRHPDQLLLLNAKRYQLMG